MARYYTGDDRTIHDVGVHRRDGASVVLQPVAEPLMKPDFVIIGGQRSGSTALMRLLGDHPHVYMPPGETRYFRDPWFSMESPTMLDREMETDKPRVKRRGIKCPDLLGEAASARRILDTLGPVDLVAVLREPVDRAISAYFWGMQWGLIPLAPPEVGLRRILEGKYADHPRAAEVLTYGLYARNLASFLEIFSRDRLLVLIDEELRSDFRTATVRLLRHLDLDPGIPLKPSRERVNEGVYNPTRLRLLQRRHRYILRPYPGYEGKFLQPAQGLVGRSVNRSIAALDRVVLARLLPNDKPPISRQLRSDLLDYFRGDIDKLAVLLERDLTPWIRRNEQYIGAVR